MIAPSADVAPHHVPDANWRIGVGAGVGAGVGLGVGDLVGAVHVQPDSHLPFPHTVTQSTDLRQLLLDLQYQLPLTAAEACQHEHSKPMTARLRAGCDRRNILLLSSRDVFPRSLFTSEISNLTPLLEFAYSCTRTAVHLISRLA